MIHSSLLRRRRFDPVEILEARIAPAAVTAPAVFNYTDTNGDAVKVQIVGKGSVEFLDANGGDVSTTGLDIAKIIVTAPNPNFALLFSDTNSLTGLGLGDNTIELGKISGPNGARLPMIKGVFTADSSPGVKYDLGGYIGSSFTPGGGLKILGPVVSDSVSATKDIDLSTLNVGAAIAFRDGVDAGASVSISKAVAGTFQSGPIAGDLSFGNVSGRVQLGPITGTATVLHGVSGRVELGAATVDAMNGRTTEEFTIGGGVGPNATILSHQDVTLHVGRTFAGFLNVSGSVELDVTGALSGGSINAGNDLTLKVMGAVSNSGVVAGQGILIGSKLSKGVTASEFIGGNGANIAVTGSVQGSRFSGGQANLTLDISGSVLHGQFLSGGDANVTVGFSVDDSSILSDGRLGLTVGRPPMGATAGVGDLTRSVIGSKSTSAIVNVGGKVSGSQFTTGTDLTVTAGSTMDSNVLQAGNNFTLTAATSVVNSRIVAGSDATVTIGGRLSNSALLISNSLDATIGQSGAPVVLKKVPSAGVILSRIETSVGNATLTVIGPVSGTLIESGLDASLSVSDVIGLDAKTNQPKIVKAGNVGSGVYLVTAGNASVTSTSLTGVGARLFAAGDASVDIMGRYSGAISAAGDVKLVAGAALFATDPLPPLPPLTGVAAAGAVPFIFPVVVDPASTLPPPPVLPTVPGSGNSVHIVPRTGLQAGGDLSLKVAHSVVSPVISVGGDVTDFQVGGSLSSRVYVGGSFSAGTTTSNVTVIGGTVSPSTLIRIGGDLGAGGSAPTFIFGHGFAGRLQIGGNITVDLSFQGNVNSITVDGGFAPMPGNLVADIIVQGRLNVLTTADLFTRTSASGGTFAHEGGALPAGALNASGGALSVGPFIV